MISSITILPFYESLGEHNLEFIINQTELITICVDEKGALKILDLKKKETISSLQNMILFEEKVSEELKIKVQEAKLKLFTFD